MVRFDDIPMTYKLINLNTKSPINMSMYYDAVHMVVILPKLKCIFDKFVYRNVDFRFTPRIGTTIFSSFNQIIVKLLF